MNFRDYNKLTLNGQTFIGNEILDFCTHSLQKNVQDLGDFMTEWLAHNPKIKVRTSGSTGVPKLIEVEKNQMLASAAATAGYFGFEAVQTALLCLPMSYIAGKMMVVRALLSQLNLICEEPNRNPLSNIPENTVIDFAPLTPMQLQGVENTKRVRKILLGGGPVGAELELACQNFDAEIYHGYGMTETLSHIALRRINGKKKSSFYKALPGVAFQQDSRGCLQIKVPFLSEPVVTNDIVELLDEQSFVWRGRLDNIINSGGIKLFPEETEKKIYPYLKQRFFVAGLPDEKLGEKLCLIIEGKKFSEVQMAQLQSLLTQNLSKYERPKAIFFVPYFLITESGKIQRKKTLDLLKD